VAKLELLDFVLEGGIRIKREKRKKGKKKPISTYPSLFPLFFELKAISDLQTFPKSRVRSVQ
jgi:hypothetical protein